MEIREIREGQRETLTKLRQNSVSYGRHGIHGRDGKEEDFGERGL